MILRGKHICHTEVNHQLLLRLEVNFTCYAPISVKPQGAMGNPGDSDSFLTLHPGGYDNGAQIQGKF